jgi:hypothetical protein
VACESLLGVARGQSVAMLDNAVGSIIMHLYVFKGKEYLISRGPWIALC